jgi:hypothetical protein
LVRKDCAIRNQAIELLKSAKIRDNPYKHGHICPIRKNCEIILKSAYDGEEWNYPKFRKVFNACTGKIICGCINSKINDCIIYYGVSESHVITGIHMDCQSEHAELEHKRDELNRALVELINQQIKPVSIHQKLYTASTVSITEVALSHVGRTCILVQVSLHLESAMDMEIQCTWKGHVYTKINM